jgi:hypothetical protein
LPKSEPPSAVPPPRPDPALPAAGNPPLPPGAQPLAADGPALPSGGSARPAGGPTLPAGGPALPSAGQSLPSPGGPSVPAGNGGANALQPGQQGRAGDARLPLPRRQRQANLAPQLAADTASAGIPTAPEPGAPPSPEQARDTMSAVLRGTRQARQIPPPHLP